MSKKKTKKISPAQNRTDKPSKRVFDMKPDHEETLFELETPEVRAQDEKIALPVLGHQLTIEASKVHENWYRIAPTASQRIRHFVTAFIEAFLIAGIALVIFYLPDYIADYSHRSEAFLHFFYRYIPVLGGAVAVCAAISAVLKDVVCYVNPRTRQILCTHRLTAENIAKAVDLQNIPVIDLVPPTIVTKRSRLIAIIHDMETPIADVSGNTQDIQAFFDWIADLKSRKE